MSPRPQQPLSHLLFGPLVRLRHRAPLVVLTIGLATLLAACATPPPRAAVLDIGPRIAPGVPLVRVCDARNIGLALKSGNFGRPDFFSEALARMEAA